MRSITFGQALLAVGLIGLTLILTLGWELIFWVLIGDLAEVGPSILGPTTMLAIAFAFALVVIGVGVSRLTTGADTQPLTFAEMLVVVGVLGLLLAALFSFQSVVSMAIAEWLQDGSSTPEKSRLERSYLEQLGNFVRVLPSYLAYFSSGRFPVSPPSYSGAVAIQVFAFLVPCAVIGAGMKRRVGDFRREAAPAQVPTAAQLAMCLSLLGLTAWLAIAPVTLYSIALENSFFSRAAAWSQHWVDLTFFAVGGAGPALALIFLLVLPWRNRGSGGTSWVLAPAGLVALTVASATSLHTWALFAVLAAFLLTGLFRIYWLARPSGNDSEAVLSTPHVLAAVAAVGLLVLVVTLPQVFDAAARWRLADLHYGHLPHYGSLIALPAIACAINVALLALALRAQGGGDRGEGPVQ
ncbi:MAG: hypothetical protein F4152_07355 [Dehalococcoidia bacterium]|nr:hypothetical protein [Dehalococcoidia bacterium]